MRLKAAKTRSPCRRATTSCSSGGPAASSAVCDAPSPRGSMHRAPPLSERRPASFDARANLPARARSGLSPHRLERLGTRCDAEFYISSCGIGTSRGFRYALHLGNPRKGASFGHGGNDRLFARREIVMPGEPGACAPHFGGLAIEKLTRCRMPTIFLAAIGRNASPICPAHTGSRAHPNRMDDEERHAGDFEYQQRRGLIRLHPERPRQ